MAYFTYVLISGIKKKTYVGHTDNIRKRLKEHNSGRSIFSSAYNPWEVLHKEQFENLSEATKRERYLKSAAGRRWMKKYLFKSLGRW